MLWPLQSASEDWIQFLLPPSTLLFPSPLLLPAFLHYSALLPDARTTDPASVSATATTIGRRKEERGRDKEDHKEEAGGQEEIDA